MVHFDFYFNPSNGKWVAMKTLQSSTFWLGRKKKPALCAGLLAPRVSAASMNQPAAYVVRLGVPPSENMRRVRRREDVIEIPVSLDFSKTFKSSDPLQNLALVGWEEYEHVLAHTAHHGLPPKKKIHYRIVPPKVEELVADQVLLCVSQYWPRWGFPTCKREESRAKYLVAARSHVEKPTLADCFDGLFLFSVGDTLTLQLRADPDKKYRISFPSTKAGLQFEVVNEVARLRAA